MAQRPTRAEPLSRERILGAALALVAEHGLDGLSMRRLAEELDVWPMSLYRYFHDKEELLAALGDAAAGEIGDPPRTGSWQERIAALLSQARSVLERHPGILRPDAEGSATARVREHGLAILAEAGFPPADAERAWHALLAYTAGAVDFASAEEEFAWGLDRLLDGLAAETLTPGV